MQGARKMKKKMAQLVLLLLMAWIVLSTLGCDGNVYVGVRVAGPYAGYPYGGYPGGYGGVYVGRPY